jgi:hypothetical protein
LCGNVILLLSLIPDINYRKKKSQQAMKRKSLPCPGFFYPLAGQLVLLNIFLIKITFKVIKPVLSNITIKM